MIWVVHPGSDPGSRFFTHPGSRIQGSKRHRIPDLDPQHGLIMYIQNGKPSHLLAGKLSMLHVCG
jgi:hypothetical protein